MPRLNDSIRVSIAPFLAGLALAFVDGGCNTSGGQCGTETTDTFPLDAFELGQLQGSPDPMACLETCRANWISEPITCSWSVSPDGGITSADPSTGSTSAADGSTTSEATTDGSTTTDATTTGDAGTGGTSTGGTSTGDASTTGDGTTSLGGIPRAGSTGGFEGAAGELSCTYFRECVGGRGHEALQPAAPPPAVDELGRWLATMAHSEAASVIAFQAIADELEAHEAPPELVLRARAAADDEVRHAEVMGALARRHGAEPAHPRFSALEVRELEALALENAIEGCVRETWAALEACCQARRAADPRLRCAMELVAADECRHAQLSWDLDAWVRTKLAPGVVARIDAARRRAVDALERELTVARPAPLLARAGLPDPVTAQHLLAELRRALWS